MELNDAVKGKIEDYIKGNRVVLFMKGTRQSPMCGFSAKTVAALDSVVPEYIAVNVLDDPDIREGIKVYGNWPTIPQLYIDGELVQSGQFRVSERVEAGIDRTAGRPPTVRPLPMRPARTGCSPPTTWRTATTSR